MFGIDVSNHQGEIDWTAVNNDKKNVQFAFLKSSEGMSFSDAFYARNRREANRIGIPIGAYHFGRVRNDAEDEAIRFLRIAAIRPGDLRPVLDIEETDGHTPLRVRQWAFNFCNQVSIRSGVRPFIYSYPAFIRENGFAAIPQLRRFPLWLASWQADEPEPILPWKSVTVWQNSSKGNVSGVNGRCDTNRWLDLCDPLACWKVSNG